MKLLNIKKMQQFVGKICTVLTVVGKHGFDDKQFANFFVGLVDSVDEDGVFITHPVTGAGSFFALPHVVGILSEYVENIEPKQAQEITKVVPGAKSLPDFDLLTNLVKESQKKMVRKEV